MLGVHTEYFQSYMELETIQRSEANCDTPGCVTIWEEACVFF